MMPPTWQSNAAEALTIRGGKLWVLKLAGTTLGDRLFRCREMFAGRDSWGHPSTVPLWASAPVLNSSMERAGK